MTPAEVERLIAAGESFTVEFKGEAHAPLGDAELVESVVCLANGEGGVLLIGVEDDGTVTGARRRHEAGMTDPRRVAALIANRTRPSLAVRCAVIDLPAGQVIEVEVDEAHTPVGTVDGKYVRRATVCRGEPGCLPFHFHEMQAYRANRGQLDFSALTLPDATWDDLDPLEFERFRRLIRESGSRGDSALLALPDLELGKSLGVIDANHDVRAIRAGALLLFGREAALRRLIPTHEVAFQVLDGPRAVVNDFFRRPLPWVVEELVGRFRARVSEEEVLVGAVRVGVPSYPETAFREALANALVHRDYQRLGAIHVQWHTDHLALSNPGGFPRGVTLENLLIAAPHPRNPLLADAFKRAGIVERTGRGVDVLFEAALRTGRGAPDYSRSTRDDVVVVLRDGPAPLDLVRLMIQQERAHGPLALAELLAFQAARSAPRVTVAEAARAGQLPLAEATAALERLVQRGLLTRAAPGAAASWYSLSAPARAVAGAPPEDRRRRTTGTDDPPAHRILDVVRRRGRITRAETAALTNLGSDQAKRILDRLTLEGQLRRAGAGRGTYYELAAPAESNETNG